MLWMFELPQNPQEYLCQVLRWWDSSSCFQILGQPTCNWTIRLVHILLRKLPRTESFCSESSTSVILYPRVFSVGKLSLSFKFQKQRNYERNYWVNTLMPIIFGAARDKNQLNHPVWNYLYQERKALLIPLLPTLAMTHLGHDLPYHKSTIITKLKEPTVLLTKKSCSALRWPAGKKPEMNLREYLHKFDIVPWIWVKGH